MLLGSLFSRVIQHNKIGMGVVMVSQEKFQRRSLDYRYTEACDGRGREKRTGLRLVKPFQSALWGHRVIRCGVESERRLYGTSRKRALWGQCRPTLRGPLRLERVFGFHMDSRCFRCESALGASSTPSLPPTPASAAAQCLSFPWTFVHFWVFVPDDVCETCLLSSCELGFSVGPSNPHLFLSLYSFSAAWAQSLFLIVLFFSL